MKTISKSTPSLEAFLVLPLFFLGLTGRASAQGPGTFTATGAMTTARWGHSATLLLDGRVLIAGGWNSFVNNAAVALASAELYDPSTGTFSTVGDMTRARAGHSATLLADGRVLITGGGRDQPFSAELYDPFTGTFSATSDMTGALGPATSLADGRVLIAGEPAAQIYDPVTHTLTATGPYAGTGATRVFTATLLADGRVLIYGDGGFGHPAFYTQRTELYDPLAGTFAPTGQLFPRWMDAYTTTVLLDGTVLVAGGDDDSFTYPVGGAAIYDPSDGERTPIGNMTAARASHTATLLSDGKVLIAGSGLVGGGGLASAELYDPVTGTFAAAANMTTSRYRHTATLLRDGTVLIAGGETGSHPYIHGVQTFVPALTSSAEIYQPTSLQAPPVLLSLSGDGRGQGAILHGGTAQLAWSGNPAVAGEVLEIYGRGLIDGSAIPPQVAIGGRMAEVLFFGKAPGFSGLNQVNVRVPSGTTPGPAVSVRLMYLGRPSNEVTIGVK
ncbi:MAG: hypothetical protein L0387_20705 [Acidobacteria bacterium]|nr:hypothetical protein [Acidobacteriota bacterium]